MTKDADLGYASSIVASKQDPASLTLVKTVVTPGSQQTKDLNMLPEVEECIVHDDAIGGAVEGSDHMIVNKIRVSQIKGYPSHVLSPPNQAGIIQATEHHRHQQVNKSLSITPFYASRRFGSPLKSASSPKEASQRSKPQCTFAKVPQSKTNNQNGGLSQGQYRGLRSAASTRDLMNRALSGRRETAPTAAPSRDKEANIRIEVSHPTP